MNEPKQRLSTLQRALGCHETNQHLKNPQRSGPALPIRLAGICLLIAIATLAGCDSVISQYPLGTAVGPKDPLKLTGIWRLSGGSSNNANKDDQTKNVKYLYIKQLSGGEVRIAAIRWQNGKFELFHRKAELTKDDGVYYINMIPKNDKTEKSSNQYVFFRVIPSGDHVIVVPPSVNYFEKVVKSGRLAGHVKEPGSSIIVSGGSTQKAKKTSVTFTGVTVDISSTQKALNAAVKPDLAAQQFDLNHVLILQRIGQVH